MTVVAHTLDALLCLFAVPLLIFVMIVIGAVLLVVRVPQRRPPDARQRGFEVTQSRDGTSARDDDMRL